MTKNIGFTWHCHHNVLAEWCFGYNERENAIKTTKPKNEIETRLRLFKFVKGKLPLELVEARQRRDEAWQRRDEAWQRWVEARQKWTEARQKCDEARQKYYEARQKPYEALSKHKDFLEVLHKKECGCKEWNGNEIVFPKE